MDPSNRKQRGTSLIEVLMVVVIMGTVLTAGIPHMAVAFEGARSDEAGSMLRGLWNAERMHWLEYRTFTIDIDALIADKFIDQPVKDATEPFSFAITAADASSFTATATRAGSGTWSGTLSIDESGLITGDIQDENGVKVQPYEG